MPPPSSQPTKPNFFERLRISIAYRIFMFHNRPYKLISEKATKRIVSAKITNFKSKSLTRLITRLHFTLRSQSHGQRLGIAAPQIGVYKQVMIAYGELYINPEWQPSAQIDEMVEGCYTCSDGHNVYRLQRPKYGWAKWQDAEGKFHEEKLNGIKAIVFQHELDHLRGILISDIGTLQEPSQPKDAPMG